MPGGHEVRCSALGYDNLSNTFFPCNSLYLQKQLCNQVPIRGKMETKNLLFQ